MSDTDAGGQHGDDDQVYFRTRDHPEHPANPDGKECVECGDSAFIVTERMEAREDRLNDIVTGDPLCREHFEEVSGLE